MIANLFVRVIVAGFSYFIAVLGAAAFFVLAVVGLDAIQPHPGELMIEFMVRVGLYIGLVATVAARFSSAPVLLVIVAAEALRLRGFVAYLATGAVMGALAVFIWDAAHHTAGQQEYVIAIASGAIGAVIYWALAGRNSGKWRDRTQRSPLVANDDGANRDI
ncbi:MAG: hypothetical protein KDJ77_14345 [Rhodobiaceae bacterium]|nr:hypothetical protein [Rhodobiaceae bacterium]